jgi:hypothetical protein
VGHLGTTGYPRTGVQIKLVDVTELNVSPVKHRAIAEFVIDESLGRVVYYARQALSSWRVSHLLLLWQVVRA